MLTQLVDTCLDMTIMWQEEHPEDLTPHACQLGKKLHPS